MTDTNADTHYVIDMAYIKPRFLPLVVTFHFELPDELGRLKKGLVFYGTREECAQWRREQKVARATSMMPAVTAQEAHAVTQAGSKLILPPPTGRIIT